MNSAAVSKTVALIIAIIVIVAAACGAYLLYTSQQAGKVPSKIKIGVQLPLSGSLAKMGEKELNGIKLAVKHFMEDNPGIEIELVVKDDESNPEKAATTVEKLITIDKVVAITGGYGSHIIYPASEVAEKYKTIYITSGGVSPGLVERGFKYFFRITTIEGYAKAQAYTIRDVFKAKKVAIIYNEKTATTEVAMALKKILEDEGIAEVVLFESYPAGTADFKPILSKVAASGAEILVNEGYTNDHINCIKSAAAMKLKVNAYMGAWALVTKSLIDALGDLSKYAYGTVPWEYGLAPPEAKSVEDRFYNDFKSEYGYEPDYLSMLGYVQTKLLLEAIKRVIDAGKELNSDNIRAELLKVDEITPIGRVKFDERGETLYYTVSIAQIQDGSWVAVWTPATGATGKAVYPAVGWG